MDHLIAAATPIALGLVQVLSGVLPDRWKPVASIVTGLVAVACYGLAGQIPWAQVPLAGILAGLAASGLYSGARAVRGL